ncbi:hypothetical protein [Enterococcus wangshanyuanii]|uniref:Uncharacterized protein n=1 Tax=Enterococcus wangshanyuanii TaxID=2005703 RepID=A0ABQ1PTL2_9ENTE|nr:hypothetical protein [Enterococcus wangshanyuanii]GGD03416.1 hypothetical protein GCM10011573_36090 [Enterococcus wangshanyuanii]
MFNFLKGTFRFEVIHSDNIQTESILTPESLVNYVIGVNNHLIKAEETGWVYAEKFKEGKKGKELLYAFKIELPLYEDNPYFDQLLSPFYTKKKLPFEEVVLPEATKETESKAGTPELPSELQALAESGTKRLEEQEPEPSEIGEVNSEEQELVDLNEDQAEQQQLIENLMYQLEIQQEEIQKLKQENASNISLSDPFSNADIKTELVVKKKQPEVSSDKSYPGLSLDSIEPKTEKTTVLSTPESVDAVSDVLDLVKNEFSSRLSNFVEEETIKINQEIKELDTRHLIEEEVTKRVQAEKQRTIDAEILVLDNEEQKELKEEQQRHELAVATIKRTCAEKKANKEQELDVHFKDKLANDIAVEYKTQTEQLTRILQGKKDELAFKQKEMNEGLKTNFAQVLASFNETHEKVIEQVEQQKVANQPIDFLAHKKAAN